MEYSAESVRYLHVAYALFIAVQVGYVAWLGRRWNRVQADTATEASIGRKPGR